MNIIPSNSIVQNAKGDLNISLSGTTITANAEGLIANDTLSLTFGSDGSISANQASDLTSSGGTTWVQTGTGWQGASNYQFSYPSGSVTGSGATISPSSSGTDILPTVFNLTVGSTKRIYSAQWNSVSITNLASGAQSPEVITFTIRLIGDTNDPI